MASRITFGRHARVTADCVFGATSNKLNRFPGTKRRHSSKTKSSNNDAAVPTNNTFTPKRLGLLVASMTTLALVVTEGTAESWWSARDENDDETCTTWNLPRIYDRSAIQDYWKQRPISILRRLGQVVYELGPIGVRYIGYNHSPFASKTRAVDVQLKEQIIGALSKDFKEALTNLGPAWIKGESCTLYLIVLTLGL